MISEAVGIIRVRARQSALLIGNAGSLAMGSVITAVLGFFFWAFAARNFSPDSVGYASAAISLMNFTVLIGEFGFGTLILAEIQRDLKRAPQLVSAVLLGALAASLMCGFAAVATCHLFSVELGDILNTRVGSTLFIIACAATGFGMVLEGVLVGFLRSHWQFFKNLTLAVLKLALLVALVAVAQGDSTELSIFSTWFIALLASILLVAALAIKKGERIWVTPAFDTFRPLIVTALKHHALNIATMTPTVLLPFLVAATLSAATNAAFFAGWMLLSVVLMIPSSLTTVLVTVGIRDPHAQAHDIALTLAISAATGLAASIGFFFLGDFILRLFNPAYPEIMGPSLKYLGLCVFPLGIKYHYIALQRLHHRMLSASLLVGAGALLELSLAIAGARVDGLLGLTAGWMLAVFIEAIVMLPSVLAALPLDPRLRRPLS